MLHALPLMLALGAAVFAMPHDDWAATPEASFMTAEERRAWKRLDSAAAREEFERTYWRRRDPTPDTDRNEFQEQVLARIRSADERFTIGSVPGSRTARGSVYIVLGAPAKVRTTSGPLETTPRQEVPATATLPRTALAGTAWEEWVYDRGRNAELLDVLKRPFVEIAFVVERSRDQIQRQGLFAAYREAVARRSIVRP